MYFVLLPLAVVVALVVKEFEHEDGINSLFLED